MTPISYRCATHDDIELLNYLHIASYSEFEKSLPVSGWATLNANLRDNNKLKDVFGNSRAFVGEIDGSIVGMAFLVSNGKPARHIYESLGFTVYKEIDRIFGVRYWLYKMNL